MFTSLASPSGPLLVGELSEPGRLLAPARRSGSAASRSCACTCSRATGCAGRRGPGSAPSRRAAGRRRALLAEPALPPKGEEPILFRPTGACARGRACRIQLAASGSAGRAPNRWVRGRCGVPPVLRRHFRSRPGYIHPK